MNEIANKYHALILRRIAEVTQVTCALETKLSESTISRLFSGDHVKNTCLVLDSLDLKIVPASTMCFRPEDIDPYIKLAKKHMESIGGAESLQWEGK